MNLAADLEASACSLPCALTSMNRAKSGSISRKSFKIYEINISRDRGRSLDKQIIGAPIANEKVVPREEAPEPKLRLPAPNEATRPHMAAYAED